ncbi:AraC family transcriptional regulator [Caulobacter sp. D4A]|uniref:AraC family transcriptional regulator n=1 Tax=unclassified Caulobacter TaxID=2648921 RepID=UPI000D72C38D|nr:MULTISPECIES: helix-turn-helix transcriptional regulator [unclassified Caulobacter]PXA85342.1 AraC family transcriptional regulator [Caulobacter sp. D4A]PXA88549.1 AraC family transcriptional regulator [Caulobacter sp. D5]
MPIISDLTVKDDWIEPDEVPRPIVVFGAMMDEVGGIELDPHRHRKGQIILVQRGALSCEVEGGLWVVPPRSAIWIPGGALHAIRANGALEGYNAFIDTQIDARLPKACCAVSVTPLLRELLARAAHLPYLYDEGGANCRLVSVLLDEVAAAHVEDLHLPMPADPRLRRIVDEMMAAPAARGSLAAWAKRAGMSERTLMRLIDRETGMSFGRWRQQLCVVLAVKWLAAGASIQSVAADLGYESTPSFVTMFRKALGASPGRYMAERHPGRA